MSRFLVAVLGALLVVSAGCQMSGEAEVGGGGRGGAQMMSTDACPHCQGAQTLKADGTCPKCGMNMSNAKMMSADACPHCTGIQTATADGKCAECEAKK